MGFEDWHTKLYDLGEKDLERAHLEPFNLKTATENQVNALREQAQEWGFKDLRGFHQWMRSVDVTYYDIIKVASP